MKYGTAPALMTTCVCSEVPEAMSIAHDGRQIFKLPKMYKSIALTGQSPCGLELEHVVLR